MYEILSVLCSTMKDVSFVLLSAHFSFTSDPDIDVICRFPGARSGTLVSTTGGVPLSAGFSFAQEPNASATTNEAASVNFIADGMMVLIILRID